MELSVVSVKETKKVFTRSTSLPVLVRFRKIRPGVLKGIITKISFTVLLIQKLTSHFLLIYNVFPTVPKLASTHVTL